MTSAEKALLYTLSKIIHGQIKDAIGQLQTKAPLGLIQDYNALDKALRDYRLGLEPTPAPVADHDARVKAKAELTANYGESTTIEEPTV